MVIGAMSKSQIGKNGLTAGVIQSLQLAFKKNKIVRISLLKSAVNERKKIKQIAEEITNKLDGNYKYKVIGFTIVIKKTGKMARSKVYK